MFPADHKTICLYPESVQHNIRPGDIVRVEIDEADETDLWGTLVG